MPPYQVPQYSSFPTNMVNYNYINPNSMNGVSSTNTTANIIPNSNVITGSSSNNESQNSNKSEKLGNLLINIKKYIKFNLS